MFASDNEKKQTKIYPETVKASFCVVLTKGMYKYFFAFFFILIYLFTELDSSHCNSRVLYICREFLLLPSLLALILHEIKEFTKQ